MIVVVLAGSIVLSLVKPLPVEEGAVGGEAATEGAAPRDAASGNGVESPTAEGEADTRAGTSLEKDLR